MKTITKKEYLNTIGLIELNNNYQFIFNRQFENIEYNITTLKESNIYFVKGFINDMHINKAFETLKECKKYLKGIILNKL